MQPVQPNQPVSRSVFVISVVVCFVQFTLPSIDAYSVNKSLLIGPQHINDRYGKFSIDDLMNGKFPNKVSDDIDMDPTKWSEFTSLHYIFPEILCSIL